MFGLLNSSQIYGLQQTHEKSNLTPSSSSSSAVAGFHPTSTTSTALAAAGTSSHLLKHRRSASNASDAGKESRLLASLSAASHGMKSPTNFIEKFIKSELLNGYDTIKNYKNFHHSANQAPGLSSGSPHAAGVISSFSCLHGSYRSNVEGEFYEAVNVSSSDMTPKRQQPQQQPLLQSYQKLSDSEADLPPSLFPSSGASSGEFNSNSSDSTTTTTQTTTNNYNNNNGQSNRNSLFKKMQNGGKARKSLDMTNGNTNEITSDNSSSSISTTTNASSSSQTSAKSNELQRSSSSASSGVAGGKTKAGSTGAATTAARERKKATVPSAGSAMPAEGAGGERSQRRKLMQMISNYDQQNKLLQRELAKEKRRRSEELAVVVKSLLCFESKLKTDMKAVNQRLQEKDAEICRLVRQNRALRKQLQKAHDAEGENTKDEGVGVEEDGVADAGRQLDLSDEDCLVLEALQCINCRKQFYDIDLKEGWTQTQAKNKDGGRANDGHTTELGSSSDDTVSSSFYGARRSVRYTSKRTSGTFRDYMRSRSMHIDDDEEDDDAQLEDNNSEGNTSSISRDDSRHSYEKMNLYSRTIERMHGVKSGEGSSDGGRCASRASTKSSGSSSAKSAAPIEEDDGIFSPTQDEDFEEDDLAEEEEDEAYKVTKRRSMEFSEASPKQVYEVSTDDWYASASDQEDASAAPKSYGQNAVNPVLECVNQILLQQSMEEPLPEEQTPLRQSLEPPPGQANGGPKSPHHLAVAAAANLPRRSSLSGRRSSRSSQSHSSDGHSRNGTLTRKRVHFSTKNSMVHVPRNDDHDEDEQQQASHDGPASGAELEAAAASSGPYYPMNYYQAQMKSANAPPPAVATSATPTSVIYAAQQREEHERLETLNYESIYSNEYEPIGSEHNSSNLYVDMESTTKSPEGRGDAKLLKLPLALPPALPPKPANLLKFKKSLQQLDEMPDEHLQHDEDCGALSTTTASEPDYCSISEVNVAVGRVQIVADVHKAPESEPDLEPAPASELDLEVSTVASVRSDDTCAESHKTDEIEEIFADIPKLPNVAAIIGPKNSPKFPQQQQSDHYLLMSPKVETPSMKLQSALKLTLNASEAAAAGDFLLGSPNILKSPKVEPSPLALQLSSEARQFKRKHVPNILVEINKRMHNPSTPSSPSTPTKASLPSPKKPSMLKSPQATSLPLLQAEFDWYNLDAEYGKAPSLGSSASSAGAQHTPDILKVSDNLGSGSMLEEIHEDHESVVAGADEYNLDEEFSLTGDRPDLVLGEEQEQDPVGVEQSPQMEACLSAICEAVNFPLFSESSPQPAPASKKANAKKMRKNLANFEKFIEGSGLSTKTLPSKRKIYFAGPFV